MKPKPYALIAFCLLILMAVGCMPTRHIRLKKVPEPRRANKLLGLAYSHYTDTAFIAIRKSEDMGVVSGSYYQFKPNLKNARYLVYINDTLVEKQAFKNGQRNGIYTMYIKGVKNFKVPWQKGSPRGKGRLYFANGKTNTITVYQNGSAIIRWTYNENHKTTREEFFINHITVRLVDYDDTGRIKAIHNKQRILNTDPDNIGSLQSGKKEYKYLQGTIVAYYKNGKNKKWIFSPTKK